MIAGELPEAAPETPVDVWMWTFFKSIRTVRDISFDAAAKLMRVDCRERTLQSQRVELFLEDRQVAGECQVFCVWVIGSMLPERSKDDDDFRRTAGRAAEGLQAA